MARHEREERGGQHREGRFSGSDRPGDGQHQQCVQKVENEVGRVVAADVDRAKEVGIEPVGERQKRPQLVQLDSRRCPRSNPKRSTTGSARPAGRAGAARGRNRRRESSCRSGPLAGRPQGTRRQSRRTTTTRSTWTPRRRRYDPERFPALGLHRRRLVLTRRVYAQHKALRSRRTRRGQGDWRRSRLIPD